MKLKKSRRRSGRIVLEITDYNGDTSREKPDTSRPPKKSHVGASKANVNTFYEIKSRRFVAAALNRWIYLINFVTELDTLDIRKYRSLGHSLPFRQTSFVYA